MPLYITRLTETAQLPIRASEYAAGLDVYADETVTIHEYHRAWVSTGLAIALDPYHVGQIWPRSGLAGHGLDTSAGVIDADYRGEVKVLLVNGTPHKKVVHTGDRIAQLLIIPVARPEMVETEALPETERGANGFGSTGRSNLYPAGSCVAKPATASNPAPAPDSGDAIVEAVRARLLERSLVGQQKYGVTMLRQDLDTLDWIRHAQEEALDLTVYLERVYHDLQRMLATYQF